MENNTYGFVEVEKFQVGGKTYERFSHRTGGLCFLLALLLPQLLGGMALIILANIISENSDPYLFFAYFITQAVMALALLISCNFKFKNTLSSIHFNMPIKKSDIWLMLPLSFGVLFGLNFLPSIFILLLEQFGYVMATYPFPDTTTVSGFIAGIFCICIVPAVVEESIFRGVILRSFAQTNAWKGILISSALFALMHGSAQQTVYQFVVGVILGLVAIKTNSIIPSMILHMANNAISLVIMAFPMAVQETMLSYCFIPGALAVGLIFGYYNNRQTPPIVEVEENLGIDLGSVQLRDGEREVLGMSRDISQSEYYIRKTKKYQGIIFYSSAIAFGVFMWISALMMGY